MTARRTTSVFAGFRFPPEVISLAGWYLRYGLSPAHAATPPVTVVYRRDVPEGCRSMDLSLPAVDQRGQVIDVLLSAWRDLAVRPALLCPALRAGTVRVEVTTDRAFVHPRVLDEMVPSALHTFEQYANNPVEADHGWLKARLRPMRGLKRHRSARILAAGHAFVQTCAVAATTSRPKFRAATGSAWRSTTSRSPLNPAEHPDHAPTLFREGATQPVPPLLGRWPVSESRKRVRSVAGGRIVLKWSSLRPRIRMEGQARAWPTESTGSPEKRR